MPLAPSQKKVFDRPSKDTEASASSRKTVPLGGSGSVAESLAPGSPAEAGPVAFRRQAFDDAETRHHAEENREKLAACGPGLVAEREHGGEAQAPIGADDSGEARRIVRCRVDQLEPGEGEEQQHRRPGAEPRREHDGGGSVCLRPSSKSAMRHGPYQGLIHAQRFPNSPWTRVSPTQSSVQTVSGNGLDNGSRLPQRPAATSTARKAKENRLAGNRAALPTEPSASLGREILSSSFGLRTASARKLAATATAPPAT